MFLLQSQIFSSLPVFFFFFHSILLLSLFNILCTTTQFSLRHQQHRHLHLQGALGSERAHKCLALVYIHFMNISSFTIFSFVSFGEENEIKKKKKLETLRTHHRVSQKTKKYKCILLRSNNSSTTSIEQREEKIKSEKNGWCWCLSSETHSKRAVRKKKNSEKSIFKIRYMKRVESRFQSERHEALTTK